MADLCDKYYAELNLEQPMMLAPSVREKNFTNQNAI